MNIRKNWLLIAGLCASIQNMSNADVTIKFSEGIKAAAKFAKNLGICAQSGSGYSKRKCYGTELKFGVGPGTSFKFDAWNPLGFKSFDILRWTELDYDTKETNFCKTYIPEGVSQDATIELSLGCKAEIKKPQIGRKKAERYSSISYKWNKQAKKWEVVYMCKDSNCGSASGEYVPKPWPYDGYVHETEPSLTEGVIW